MFERKGMCHVGSNAVLAAVSEFFRNQSLLVVNIQHVGEKGGKDHH